MIKITCGGRDVTINTTLLTIESQVDWAAHMCKVQVAYNAGMNFLPEIETSIGDILKVYEGDICLFDGTVMNRRILGQDCVFQLTAYSKSQALCRNDVLGIYSGTAAEITRRICGNIGIEVGQLAKGQYASIVSQGGLTAFEVIRTAYGTGYFVDYTSAGLTVKPIGHTTLTIKPENILQIVADQSIESIVNRVTVMAHGGYRITTRENPASIKKYGTYHKAVTASIPQAQQAAKEGLKEPYSGGALSLLGDFKLRAGAGIRLDLPQMGFSGVYTIKYAAHRTTGGVFITEITVEGGVI